MLQFIKRTDNSEVKMSDSALRDIIPSNDVAITKNPKRKRLSSICKVLIFIFILGFITIGILLLALIIIFSGKSFMSFILQAHGMNVTSLSNKSQVLTLHHENFTATLSVQDWEKITVIPTDSDQSEYTLPSMITTEQETESISTSTQSIKSHSSSIALIDEHTTSTMIQTTIFNQHPTTIQIQTSQENRMTTADLLTSTYLLQKIRNLETTTFKEVPITTDFSTSKSTTQMALPKFEKLAQEDIIDDLLFP